MNTQVKENGKIKQLGFDSRMNMEKRKGRLVVKGEELHPALRETCTYLTETYVAELQHFSLTCKEKKKKTKLFNFFFFFTLKGYRTGQW